MNPHKERRTIFQSVVNVEVRDNLFGSLSYVGLEFEVGPNHLEIQQCSAHKNWKKIYLYLSVYLGQGGHVSCNMYRYSVLRTRCYKLQCFISG